MKVCLVGSSGGHLTHLYMLKPFWKDKDHFWVTFDKEDARSRLEGEKMYPCYYPTNRSLKALIKNTKMASFFSYANLLNTVPYEKIKEFKSDCKFYIDSMKVCSCGLLWKLVGIKMTILYKTAQYIPFLYKASGFIRRKSR